MAEAIQRGNTSEPLSFLLVSSGDHISPVTGATPTVTISKNGGPFAAPVGTISEIGNGWYAVAADPSDANTLGVLILHATAAGADPSDVRFDVVDFNPTIVVPTPPTVTIPPSATGPTFEDVWREVRLSVPQAPVMLVRSWVQRAYKRLSDRRQWGWRIQEGQLTWADARNNLLCTVTVGSSTVTSAALFTSSDVGRQFRVGTYPIYTIIALLDASTILLDRAYAAGSPTGAQAAQILDAYATLPRGFSNFEMLLSVTWQRLVPWWASAEELSLLDPIRMNSGPSPWLLGARCFSPCPLTLGQVQYEYWPKPIQAGNLQYYTVSRPLTLSDTSVFTGVLADRTDILVTGALSQAARWPGPSKTQPNPYFNLGLSAQLETQFLADCNQLDLRDDDEYPQSFDTLQWQKYRAWAWAYDTRLLQATDATLGAYFDGFNGQSLAGWG